MTATPFEDMPPVEYIEMANEMANAAADESERFQELGYLDAAMTSMIIAFEIAGGTPDALPEDSRTCLEKFRKLHGLHE